MPPSQFPEKINSVLFFSCAWRSCITILCLSLTFSNILYFGRLFWVLYSLSHYYEMSDLYNSSLEFAWHILARLLLFFKVVFCRINFFEVFLAGVSSSRRNRCSIQFIDQCLSLQIHNSYCGFSYNLCWFSFFISRILRKTFFCLQSSLSQNLTVIFQSLLLNKIHFLHIFWRPGLQWQCWQV